MHSAFLASIIARFTFATRLRNSPTKNQHFRWSTLTGFLLLLASSDLSAAQLTVRWDDNSSTELGFKIERSTNGTTFTTIAVLGVNATSYVDSSVASSTTYWYRVRAYDAVRLSSYSNVTSATTAAITSTTTSSGSRIKTFLARAVTGYADPQSLVVNFSVVGGSKSILLRGIGPGLVPFTSAKTLPDPVLRLYSGTSLLATNDNWGGTSTLISAFQRVGAFAIPGYGKDAALLRTVAANTYKSVVNGAYSGLAQTEVYDADTAVTPTGRLTKASARATISTGAGALTSGFIIAGTAPTQVLVRAIGPSLTGVTGILQDPQLSVHQGTTLRGQNDNWGGSSTLAAAFTKAGASALSSSSKDSALLLTLSPGTYSATMSGVSSTGVGRLELYIVP